MVFHFQFPSIQVVRFSPELADTRFPTLFEALKTCSENGLNLNLEIKYLRNSLSVATEQEIKARVASSFPCSRSCSFLRQAEEALALATCQALVEFNADPAHLVLSSFSMEMLAVCAERIPQFRRAMLVWKIPDDWHSTFQRLGCCSLNFSADVCNEAQVRAIAATGTEMYAYTVNDPARAAELLSWGVSGVFSDWCCPPSGASVRPLGVDTSRKRASW